MICNIEINIAGILQGILLPYQKKLKASYISMIANVILNIDNEVGMNMQHDPIKSLQSSHGNLLRVISMMLLIQLNNYKNLFSVHI